MMQKEGIFTYTPARILESRSTAEPRSTMFSKTLFDRCLMFVILLTSWLMVVGNGNEDDSNKAAALINAGQIWVENTLKSLTLEEKVGQMLQVRYYLDYKSFDSPEYNLIR